MIEVNNIIDLKNTLNSNKYTVIKLWSEGCAPCKAMSPILSQVLVDNPEVEFVPINIAFFAEAAEYFKVKSVPYFFLYKGNNLISSFGGIKNSDFVRAEFAKLYL